MRRLGRTSALVTPPRRHKGVRSSTELSVHYSQKELRAAFRSVQSPVATTIGALTFGLGLALLLIALSTFSLGAWWMIAGGFVAAIVGGAVLAVPILQARTVVGMYGTDGVVALRLFVNQHGLVVQRGDDTTMTAWTGIDRVQIHDGHVGLVAGRRFVVPPLRLDDAQGPFVTRVLDYAAAAGLATPGRP